MNEIKIKQIGFVKNNILKPVFGGFDKVISEIIVNKEYEEALDGLKDFSHVNIIFWMDHVKTCHIKHRPQGKKDVPVVGIFACRCPARPNPIGITTAKLIEIKENIIKVSGLDVINNTPVIDIKPYTPQYDLVKDAIVPEWINKLDY